MDYQSFQPNPPAPQMPQQTSPVQKNFTPKFIGVIVLILVLSGVAYGGLWWASRCGGWMVRCDSLSIPTFTPRVIDETAGWQTYRNEELGLEFKYPGEVFKLDEMRELISSEDPRLLDKNGQTAIQLDRYSAAIYPSRPDTFSFEEALLNDELREGLGVSQAKLLAKEYINDDKTKIYTESIFVYNDSSLAKEPNIRADFLKGTIIWNDSLTLTPMKAHDVIKMDLRDVRHKDIFKKIISTAVLLDSGWRCEGALLDRCPSGYICKHRGSSEGSGTCIKPESINSYRECWAMGYTIIESKPTKCRTPEGLIFTNHTTCIQVITSARNTETGETREFPTPCDVPEGWVKI